MRKNAVLRLPNRVGAHGPCPLRSLAHRLSPDRVEAIPFKEVAEGDREGEGGPETPAHSRPLRRWALTRQTFLA